jgi:arylsulfatase
VDGKVVSTEKLDRTVPLTLMLDQRFFIGNAGPSSVDDRDYQVPFNFSGKINKLTIAIDPPKLTPDDVKKLEEANRAAQDAK